MLWGFKINIGINLNWKHQIENCRREISQEKHEGETSLMKYSVLDVEMYELGAGPGCSALQVTPAFSKISANLSSEF